MKPRVLLLAEKPNWALHIAARAVAKYLHNDFTVDIDFTITQPRFDPSRYDIIHILFWEAINYRPLLTTRHKVVKSVFSHRWQESGMTAQELYRQYLAEAHAVTVPSLHLLSALQEIPVQVHLWSEGVDTDLFSPAALPRTGDIVVGWAGNVSDPIKRIDWLQSACSGLCELRVADGSLLEQEMVEFYRNIDVIACSSVAEGCPRPLLEGMASGAFPVSFDVGIAPEVIHHGHNGLLVEPQSPSALRNVIRWSADHPEHIRSMRTTNIQRIRALRQWQSVVQPLAALYRSLL